MTSALLLLALAALAALAARLARQAKWARAHGGGPDRNRAAQGSSTGAP